MDGRHRRAHPRLRRDAGVGRRRQAALRAAGGPRRARRAARPRDRPAQPRPFPRPRAPRDRARGTPQRPAWRCCCSTSTASRRSTTPSATTTGDLLLQHGRRPRGRRRSARGDTVARLGGDEFAILLTDLETPEQALEAAARVHAALAERVELGELAVEVEPSIGIALYPDHGSDRRHAAPARRRGDVRRQARAHRGRRSTPRHVDAYSRRSARADRATCAAAIDAGELVAALPAQGRPGEPAGSPASRRWCAGSIPSAG